MKKLMVLFIMVFIFGILGAANASLIDNLDGTVTQIRNDGSRLMWLQDASAGGEMIWDDAITWIDSLNSSNYLGYNDWRLPQTLPVNPPDYNYDVSYDGSTDHGWNITSLNSEMAYMYYVELGGVGSYDTGGNPTSPFLPSTSPFVNLITDDYWSGTVFTDIQFAWEFDFGHGGQGAGIKSSPYYAWAVRDMEPIPEPSTYLLLGSGLIGLAWFRRKFRKRQPGCLE